MWHEISDEIALSKIQQRIRDAKGTKPPQGNPNIMPPVHQHMHASNIAHSQQSTCTEATYPRQTLEPRRDLPLVGVHIPPGRMDGQWPHSTEELMKRLMALCASLDEETALRLLNNLEFSLIYVDPTRQPSLTPAYPRDGPPPLPNSEGGSLIPCQCPACMMFCQCPTCIGPPVGRPASQFQAHPSPDDYVKLLILVLATHLDAIVANRVNANAQTSLSSRLVKPVGMHSSSMSIQAQPPSSNHEQLLLFLEEMLESQLAFSRSDPTLPLHDLSASREAMAKSNGEQVVRALAATVAANGKQLRPRLIDHPQQESCKWPPCSLLTVIVLIILCV